MRRITLHIEDDRFDDMEPDEVPALMFELIHHQLWDLRYPGVHLSEIIIEAPPEPEGPSPSRSAVDPAAVDDLVQQLMAMLDAMPKAA